MAASSMPTRSVAVEEARVRWLVVCSGALFFVLIGRDVVDPLTRTVERHVSGSMFTSLALTPRFSGTRDFRGATGSAT
jgi:hypothetical protein